MEEICICGFDDLAALPKLLPPSENLRDAVGVFVDLKYALDDGPEAIRATLCLYHSYGKLDPWTYCRYMLPFFDFEKRIETEHLRSMVLVPTKTVIGASDSWGYQDLAAKDEVAPTHALQNIYELSARYVRGEKTSNVAEYYLIKPLGLVIAHEGKNRVDLFRKSGAPYIPARLGTLDYPAPDRIKVYKETDVVIAVLDARYACLIHHPRIVQPLLAAYGIRIEQCWDAGLAPLDDVRQWLQTSKPSESIQTYLSQYIDLQKVTSRRKNEAELVSAALNVWSVWGHFRQSCR